MQRGRAQQLLTGEAGKSGLLSPREASQYLSGFRYRDVHEEGFILLDAKATPLCMYKGKHREAFLASLASNFSGGWDELEEVSDYSETLG